MATAANLRRRNVIDPEDDPRLATDEELRQMFIDELLNRPGLEGVRANGIRSSIEFSGLARTFTWIAGLFIGLLTGGILVYTVDYVQSIFILIPVLLPIIWRLHFQEPLTIYIFLIIEAVIGLIFFLVTFFIFQDWWNCVAVGQSCPPSSSERTSINIGGLLVFYVIILLFSAQALAGYFEYYPHAKASAQRRTRHGIMQ